MIMMLMLMLMRMLMTMLTPGCVEASDKTGTVGGEGGKLLGKTFNRGFYLKFINIRW